MKANAVGAAVRLECGVCGIDEGEDTAEIEAEMGELGSHESETKGHTRRTPNMAR